MTIDTEMLAADAKLVVDDSGIKDLTSLTETLMQLEAESARRSEELEALTSQANLLRDVTIPEKMAELKMKDFTLTNGWKINVERFYSTTLTGEKKEAAFAWLRKTKHDDIIKNEIVTSFGRGEDQKAVDVAKLLEQAGTAFVQKQSVHPQTLKAFVKGEIEAGRELPMDLFSVYIGNRAKLTPPKG